MRFPIVLADPAWHYDDKALAGDRGAGCKYSLMDDEAIYNLPIAKIAEPNSVLLLWVTMPKLIEGLECMRRWGFAYKSCAFTWVKCNQPFYALIQAIEQRAWLKPEGMDALIQRVKTLWAIGMGRYTRANAELVLLGTRGKSVPRVDASVNQIVCAPPGKHSAKPPEVRDRIVQLFGDLPRVELFARDTAPGWISLGNEIDGQDLRDSLPRLARVRTLSEYYADMVA